MIMLKYAVAGRYNKDKSKQFAKAVNKVSRMLEELRLQLPLLH